MSEKSPWKTLSRNYVYRNDWISVREDQVIRPDGANGIYGVVETRIAAGVVALTEDRQIYLVGQYRYPTECYSWEIIEGGADQNETPLEGAKRELREEAGLIARNWRQLGGEIHLTNCHSSERAYLFLATDLEETETDHEATEILQIRCEHFEKVVEMARQGEIVDAMSIIAVYRLGDILR